MTENEPERDEVKAPEETDASDGEKKGESHGFFSTFKKAFPWKDILLGFFVPKMLFHYYFIQGKTSMGLMLALGWCGIYILQGYLKDRKLDWFPLLAIFFIFVRVSTSVVGKNPYLAALEVSMDNLMFAALYFISLAFPKPLVQVFVDAINIKEIPDFIKKSPYYRKAWVVVTFVWGLINLLQAAIIIYMKLMMPDHPEYLSGFDAVSGWPTTMLMIAFSIQFPKWYWGKYKNEIRAYLEENNLEVPEPKKA